MRATAKLAVIGAAVATLSATGAFALTDDVVLVSGNNPSTGGFFPTANDLGAVAIPASASGPCPTAASSYDADDQLPAVFTSAGGQIDLNGGTLDQPTDFCIRNLGTAPIDVTMTVPFGIASHENGACTPTESAAGDASCASGANGELVASDLRLAVTQIAGTCLASPASAIAGQVVIAQFLAPGATCRFYLTVTVNPALTEQQRLVRQSDTAEFELQFTAVDGVDPGPG